MLKNYGMTVLCFILLSYLIMLDVNAAVAPIKKLEFHVSFENKSASHVYGAEMACYPNDKIEEELLRIFRDSCITAGIRTELCYIEKKIENNLTCIVAPHPLNCTDSMCTFIGYLPARFVFYLENPNVTFVSPELLCEKDRCIYNVYLHPDGSMDIELMKALTHEKHEGSGVATTFFCAIQQAFPENILLALLFFCISLVIYLKRRKRHALILLIASAGLLMAVIYSLMQVCVVFA